MIAVGAVVEMGASAAAGAAAPPDTAAPAGAGPPSTAGLAAPNSGSAAGMATAKMAPATAGAVAAPDSAAAPAASGHSLPPWRAGADHVAGGASSRPLKRLKTGKDLLQSFASLQPHASVQAEPAAAEQAKAQPKSFWDRHRAVGSDIDVLAARFNFSPDVKKLMCMAKFLCDATISTYILSNTHKLALLLYVDGESWRAHCKQAFRYDAGAWTMQPRLSIDAWELFTALEGLFIDIAGSEDFPPAWSWLSDDGPCVQDCCVGILRRYAEDGAPPGQALECLRRVAKDNGDNLRRKTENKTWRADWATRAADMVASFKKQWDGGYCAASLTKLFLEVCDSPMPKSRGVCFEDCYVDADWKVCPASPTNDCYFKVGYQYHLTEAGPGGCLA